MILLDTDICIEILRGNKKVIQKLKQESDDISISFMSVAELYYGAEKSDYSDDNTILIESFLLSLTIINSDLEILKRFGQLKGTLYKSNKLLSDADLFIAATTLVRCNKLVTGNTKHFSRIDDLMVENWIR